MAVEWRLDAKRMSKYPHSEREVRARQRLAVAFSSSQPLAVSRGALLQRAPVVAHQRKRDAKEREDEIEREEIVVVERAFRPTIDLDDVVDEDRQGDHNSLSRLEAIHSSKDIDGIGAEDSEACHE